MALDRNRASLEFQLCQFMEELGQAIYPEYQFTCLKDKNELIVVGITDYICMSGRQQVFSTGIPHFIALCYIALHR